MFFQCFFGCENCCCFSSFLWQTLKNKSFKDNRRKRGEVRKDNKKIRFEQISSLSISTQCVNRIIKFRSIEMCAFFDNQREKKQNE